MKHDLLQSVHSMHFMQKTHKKLLCIS